MGILDKKGLKNPLYIGVSLFLVAVVIFILIVVNNGSFSKANSGHGESSNPRLNTNVDDSDSCIQYPNDSFPQTINSRRNRANGVEIIDDYEEGVLQSRKSEQRAALNNSLDRLRGYNPALKALQKFYSKRKREDFANFAGSYDKIMNALSTSDLDNLSQDTVEKIICVIESLESYGVFAKFDLASEHLLPQTESDGASSDDYRRLREYFESVQQESYGFFFNEIYHDSNASKTLKEILEECDKPLPYFFYDTPNVWCKSIPKEHKKILKDYFNVEDAEVDPDLKEKALEILKNLPFDEQTNRIFETGDFPMNVKFRLWRIPVSSRYEPEVVDSTICTICRHTKPNHYSQDHKRPSPPYTYIDMTDYVDPNLCDRIRSKINTLPCNQPEKETVLSHMIQMHSKEFLDDIEARKHCKFLTFSYINSNFNHIMRAKTDSISKRDARLLSHLYFTDRPNTINQIFSAFKSCGIVFPEKLTDKTTGEIALIPVAMHGDEKYPVNPSSMRQYLLKKVFGQNPVEDKKFSYEEFCCKPNENLMKEVEKFIEKFGPRYEKFFKNLLEARRGIYINRVEAVSEVE